MRFWSLLEKYWILNLFQAFWSNTQPLRRDEGSSAEVTAVDKDGSVPRISSLHIRQSIPTDEIRSSTALLTCAGHVDKPAFFFSFSFHQSMPRLNFRSAPSPNNPVSFLWWFPVGLPEKAFNRWNNLEWKRWLVHQVEREPSTTNHNKGTLKFN